ncbi:MAG: ABC transporter substrate-binding protein, partial [Actinomycetota bacterium]
PDTTDPDARAEPSVGSADETEDNSVRDAEDPSADEPSELVGADGTVTVEHARGTTDVPVDPQRVYAASPRSVDIAVALGAPVVGGTRWRDDIPVQPYVADLGVDIPTPTDRFNPNYEAVVELAPDLILVPATDESTQYELYSEIAPTVAYGAAIGTRDQPSWDEITEEIAGYLGRTDQLPAVRAAYDDEVERLRAAFETAGLTEATVAVVRPRETADFRLYRAGGLTAGDTLWADAGISYQEVPDSIMTGDRVWAELSAERLDEVTADLVFIILPEGLAGFAAEQLAPGSIWSTLPATADGSVCLIDDDGSEIGWFVIGPLALSQIVDDVVGCFESLPA